MQDNVVAPFVPTLTAIFTLPLVRALRLGFGLSLHSVWGSLVVMHAYLHYFPSTLSLATWDHATVTFQATKCAVTSLRIKPNCDADDIWSATKKGKRWRKCVPLLNCCCTFRKTDAVADRRNRPSVSRPVTKTAHTTAALTFRALHGDAARYPGAVHLYCWCAWSTSAAFCRNQSTGCASS